MRSAARSQRNTSHPSPACVLPFRNASLTCHTCSFPLDDASRGKRREAEGGTFGLTRSRPVPVRRSGGWGQGSVGGEGGGTRERLTGGDARL